MASEMNQEGSECETMTDGQMDENADILMSNGEQDNADDIPDHLREFDVLDEVRGDSGSDGDDRDEDGKFN